MRVPECPACADLREDVSIGGVRQLHKAHRVVMANIADGTIREVKSPSLPARRAILQKLTGVDASPDPPQTGFASLLDDDTWPDLVQHFFRCNQCDLLFQFFVNTYHGSGGKWSPVCDEDIA